MAKKDISTTVYVGTVNGKPVRKHIRASTKRELDRKVLDIKRHAESGKDLFDTALFGRWADQWISEQIEPNVGTGTLTEYRAAVKLLNRKFEKTSMKEIRLSDFQQFINQLAEEETRPGKRRSKKSLSDVKKVAASVFRYAIGNDVPNISDFFGAVRIPKSAPKETRRALTEEEQLRIIETPHRAQIPAMIMLFSGLRRGEVIALRWSDIDFSSSIIRVSRSADLTDGGATEKSGGKTAAAVRIVPIPPVLKDFLGRQKEENDILSLLVCPNAGGKMHTASSWKSMWNSYLKELNAKYGFNGSRFTPHKGGIPMMIEPFTAHYLRHTYATMLYLQGVDLETAKHYLGHSDIAVTSNIYTHCQQTLNINLLSPAYRQHLSSDFAIRTA